MSFVRFVRWFRGTVTFEVRGNFSERFLNLLNRNGIPVFHMKREKDGLTAQTVFRKYFLIRPFARKTHVRVRVIQRQGFPFWMKRYRKRMGIFIGVAVFLAGLFLSGEFVWQIQINGNKTISDDAVMQFLEEQGLSRGSWKRWLDVSEISMNLRHQYHQIGWAAVNLVGSVAQVEISERNEGDEVLEDKTPCNAVAKRSGQIVSLEVYDGQKTVKVGDVVKKGEVLASGIVTGKTGKTMVRHAKAKVLAEYPETIQIKIPLSKTEKIPLGGVKNYRYLTLGKLKMPLFLSGKKPDLCFERVFTRPVRVCGILLPFDMIVHQVIPAENRTITISKEKAGEFAQQQLNLKTKSGQRELVKKTVREQLCQNTLIWNVDCIFREDIAVQEEIFINRKKEQNSQDNEKLG